MIHVHDETVATIERRGLADGVPSAELDAHVADVLGVPPDHYAAWQLVSGALTTYADVNFPVIPPDVGLKEQLGRIWERLGSVTHAVSDADDQRVVRELIGEVFVLTDWILVGGDIPRAELAAVDAGFGRG